MLVIVGAVSVLISVVIIPRMRVPGGVNAANLGWMSDHGSLNDRAPHSLYEFQSSSRRDSLKEKRGKMGLVFHRRLAIPLWAIAFVTVAFTAPPPATVFLLPPTTLFVMAVLGVAAIIFTVPGVVPWLRTARSVVRAVPSRHRHKTSSAIAMAAGTCFRKLDEPNESTENDALDLVRMDDDGGWHLARPPA